MKQELLKGLTEEQIAKVKACKNQEEMLKLAKEEGIQLTDEQLEAVSGGFCSMHSPLQCPNCGSLNVNTCQFWDCVVYTCNGCGHQWEVAKSK